MSMERNAITKVTASSSLVVIVDSPRACRDLNQQRIWKEETKKSFRETKEEATSAPKEGRLTVLLKAKKEGSISRISLY